MSGRFVVAIALLIGAAAPAEALAGPHVTVGVSLPPVRVALPPVSIEVLPPAPEYVWVEGYYTHDRWGRTVWVPGRWERVAPPSPVVVVHPARPRPAPPPRHVHVRH